MYTGYCRVGRVELVRPSSGFGYLKTEEPPTDIKFFKANRMEISHEELSHSACPRLVRSTIQSDLPEDSSLVVFQESQLGRCFWVPWEEYARVLSEFYEFPEFRIVAENPTLVSLPKESVFWQGVGVRIFKFLYPGCSDDLAPLRHVKNLSLYKNIRIEKKVKGGVWQVCDYKKELDREEMWHVQSAFYDSHFK